MCEKYPLPCDINLEGYIPIHEDWMVDRICRYGDGYIYRITKQFTLLGELPWRCQLVFHSITSQTVFQTPVYDHVRIHMIDFERGIPYAVGFDYLSNGQWTHNHCQGEVWQDADTKKIEVSSYTVHVNLSPQQTIG